MKSDVLRWLSGQPGRKLPSKETLNHPELIELASGLNVRHDTADAYRLAYEALGIDIINIVPESNTPPALASGQVATRANGRVQASYLGVYDSSCRVHFPFQTTEAFWLADTEAITYDQLDLPGAQYLMPCTSESITRKSELIGEVGLYYYQLYTTLFMWGVEALGWEIFMLAATEDPRRFDAHFLKPMFEKSKKIIEMLSDLNTPWVFCHDDIATATGAVFHPDWYR